MLLQISGNVKLRLSQKCYFACKLIVVALSRGTKLEIVETVSIFKEKQSNQGDNPSYAIALQQIIVTAPNGLFTFRCLSMT